MSPRINLIGGDAYSFTGGIQAVNRFVVRELARTGMLRTAFFLWDGDSNVSEEGRDARERGWTRFFGRNRPAFFAALVRQAVVHPGDLWLCMHLNYALIALLLAGWRRKRVALFVYASELDEFFTPLKRFALRQIGQIIVISRYTATKALREGVAPEKVRVLYLGVEDPCPNWNPKQSHRDSNVVLFVGRMDERYKGQKELLDAMVVLRDRLPQLRLLFVGGGVALDQWKAEAEERKLAGVVEFRGRVPDAELQELYGTAAVFAMPSANEGFGLVYVEAMAHGMACIASDRDAAGEVVAHGETGFCVPAGDAPALARAIETLINDPGMRLKFGCAGRQRFVECFTTEKYRDRLLATISGWRSSVN